MPNLFGVEARVLMAGYHSWSGSRLAGMHYIAKYFTELGENVHFVTYPFPVYYAFKAGERERGLLSQACGGRSFRLGQSTVLSATAITPYGFSRLDKKLCPWVRTQMAKLTSYSWPHIPVEDYDYVVLESNGSVALVDRVDTARTKLIYRASDPLFTYTDHPTLLELERKLVARAHVTLTVNERLHSSFVQMAPEAESRIKLWKNGFEASEFDKAYASPYPEGTSNAVYVGGISVDWSFIMAAAKSCPHVSFHVIGPGLLPNELSGVVSAHRNISVHGGMPFSSTVPYIMHADLALLPYEAKPALQYAELTGKIYQYMYCKLPIITVPSQRHLSKYGVHVAKSPEDFGALVRKHAGLKNDYEETVHVRAMRWPERLLELAKILQGLGQ